MLDELSSESWDISSQKEYQIKKHIETIGTSLKDWDCSINYGIKTGFNEAFIINGEKKDELVARNPNNAKIIKPILLGKNIKRYKLNFSDKWLINIHNGYKKLPPIEINDYPTIKKHLEEIEARRANGGLGDKAKKAKGLFRRDDQGVTPYNLRNCAYLDDFEDIKIVWGNLALSAQFTLAFWIIQTLKTAATATLMENGTSPRARSMSVGMRQTILWPTLHCREATRAVVLTQYRPSRLCLTRL
jgi:hypothetical protein